MATNCADTLDPVLLLPGCLHRKIEFPCKNDSRQKHAIYTTLASKMSLSLDVDLDTFILPTDATLGAVIAAIMQNVGILAVWKAQYCFYRRILRRRIICRWRIVKGTSLSFIVSGGGVRLRIDLV
jgi:ATP-dependent 26S proteasome regulatory subunit